LKTNLFARAAAAVLVAAVAMPAHAIDVCTGGNRAARNVTCIYDGDTGWQHGLKWRLVDIDAPEIQDAACPRERTLALRSRDRVAELMRAGYVIHWNGRRDRNKRALLSIGLADGRDAGRVLMEEGLAQPWPNVGNVWCDTTDVLLPPDRRRKRLIFP
jgi:micrococcal nuclease